jgi:hypothetical protein
VLELDRKADDESPDAVLVDRRPREAWQPIEHAAADAHFFAALALEALCEALAVLQPSAGKIERPAPLAEKHHGAVFVAHEAFDRHVETLGVVHAALLQE